MIFYVTDRALNVVAVFSNDSQDTTPYFDDTEDTLLESGSTIFSATVPLAKYNQFGKSENDSQHIYRGNYIIYKDSYGRGRFFTIITTNMDSLTNTMTFIAEEAGMDLLNEQVKPIKADNAHPIIKYISDATNDSGWEIGINEIAHLSRKLEFSSTNTTSYKRVLEIATAFDNAEIAFRFDIDDMRVKHKYIDIFKKRGKDTNIELRLDNEINSIKVEESIEDLATAIWATGGTLEGKDEPITFSDINYSSHEGRYISPKGDPRLYDVAANKQWSRYKNSDEKGTGKGYIVQYFNYDTTNPTELLNRTFTALLEAKDVKYQIDIDLAYLPDDIEVGDWINTISIGNNRYFKARVLQIVRSYSDSGKSKVLLGNYVFLSSGMDSRLQELSEKIKTMRNGVDAITGYLTNETVSLTADANGTINDLSQANGTFKIVKGEKNVMPEFLNFRKISQTNCTASINFSGDYEVSYMSSDDATVVFEAAYGELSIVKILSLSKSIQGFSGNSGADGKDGLNGEDGVDGADGKDGEDGIFRSVIPPKNPKKDSQWIDTSVIPNVQNFYDGTTWRESDIKVNADNIVDGKISNVVINNGNGTFTVDSDGKVTAKEVEIAGKITGSIISGSELINDYTSYFQGAVIGGQTKIKEGAITTFWKGETDDVSGFSYLTNVGVGVSVSLEDNEQSGSGTSINWKGVIFTRGTESVLLEYRHAKIIEDIDAFTLEKANEAIKEYFRLNDSGWIDATTTNGRKVYYRKIGNKVVMTGLLELPTVVGTVFFTFPQGFRPVRRTVREAVVQNTSAHKFLYSIETNGQCKIILNSYEKNAISLDACYFYVD